MKLRRKKIKPPAKEYLERAIALSREDAERLFSRMGGKLTRRLDDKMFSAVEVVALQLELEDEQLAEWRKNVTKIRGRRKD
jgi:N-acyl-L-homoserine lactone synthetase